MDDIKKSEAIEKNAYERDGWTLLYLTLEIV